MFGRPLRLLVVDDDADSLEVLAELLELSGFEVLCARTVKQALDLINQHDVQLVLSDYQLSAGGDPWRHLDALRAAAAPAPMGVVTGWRIPGSELKDHGIAFVVEKPYQGDELLARVGMKFAGLTVSDQHQLLIRRYFEALSARDWDGFVALCTEDVVYNLPGNDPQYSTTVRGRAELKKFTAETFARFPDAKFTVKQMVALPNAAVGRYESTMPGLEKPLAGAVVFHFDGALIREIGIRVRTKELAKVSAQTSAR